MTRKSETALAHILDDVLALPAKALLRFFCAELEITTINSLMALSEEQLTNTTFTSSAGIQTTLSVATVNTIRSLRQWYHSQPLSGTDTWFNLTTNDFDDFEMLESQSVVPSVINSPPPAVVTPTASTTPADAFKRSTKRSTDTYPELKKRSGYSTWLPDFENEMATHGVENIGNPTYTATTPEEIEYDKVANSFVASALYKKLSFDGGKNICLEHKGDGRTILTKLRAHCTGGIYGETVADNLEDALKAQRYEARPNSIWRKLPAEVDQGPTCRGGAKEEHRSVLPRHHRL